MKESEREKMYLATHCVLQEFAESLSDHPRNKKLKEIMIWLSAMFRYEWELEKAKNAEIYWHDSVRQALNKVREIVEPKKKRRKKKSE